LSLLHCNSSVEPVAYVTPVLDNNSSHDVVEWDESHYDSYQIDTSTSCSPQELCDINDFNEVLISTNIHEQLSISMHVCPLVHLLHTTINIQNRAGANTHPWRTPEVVQNLFVTFAPTMRISGVPTPLSASHSADLSTESNADFRSTYAT